MRGEHVVEEVDVAVGRCAEHHAGRARADRVGHRAGRPQAAAELHRHRNRIGDPPHVLEVGRDAGAGAVEVDDVQDAGAVLHPSQCRLERIRVVHGPLVEVAPSQAHRLALEDVDGREQDHARTAAAGAAAPTPRPAHSRAKLASIRSPCVDDFSGWNWTP